MSDPNTLGSLVRRRRLESGYSLGQLASKVGKTAAEVRAWERDNELPEHGILERLAETLELDLDDIKARLESEREAAKVAAAEEAKLEDADTEDAAAADAAEHTDTEDTATEDTDTEVAVAEDAVTEQPDAKEPEADEPEGAEGEAEDTADSDEPGFPVEDPFTPPAADDAGEQEHAEQPDDYGLLDAPTEAVPVPVITETATAARAERAAAVITEPPPLPVVEEAPDADPGLLRYLEPLRLLFDPKSRYLYWIRAGLTVVVLLIFAVILFDQLGKLLDAFGELLDTIEPTATDPDDLDALGIITG